jgi:hypothetical protein
MSIGLMSSVETAVPFPSLDLPVGSTFRLECWCATANVTVTVRWGVEASDGSLSEGQLQLVVAAAYTRTTTSCSAPRGRLRFCTAGAAATGRVNPCAWARLTLHGGVSITSPAIATLLSGYATRITGPSWPFGASASPFDVNSNQPFVLVTSPAAGAQVNFTALDLQIRPLMAFSLTFNASAAVANRVVSITIRGAARELWSATSANAITAGQVVILRCYPLGFAIAATATEQWIFMPVLNISEPVFVFTTTTGMDAGDQFSDGIFQGNVLPGS